MKTDMLGVLKNLIFKKRQITLVPSLPAGSWSELESALKALSGASEEFQIDLVDGKFAVDHSWPFGDGQEVLELNKLKDFSQNFALEFDCMVLKPEQYLNTFLDLGMQRLIIHYGSTEALSDICSHARKFGYKLGLAFTSDVDRDLISDLIPKFDFIQIMGIAKVGKQGQPFDERTPDTITFFRARFPKLEIAVDGAVNKDTIPTLLQAGADRLAPGSAIIKSDDPRQSFLELRRLIDEINL